MHYKKIAREILAEIHLNNLEHFYTQINSALAKAANTLKTINPSVEQHFKSQIALLVKEVKKDFTQKKLKERVVLPIVEQPKVVNEQDIKDLGYGMAYPKRLSFIQDVKSKIKEFLVYLNDAFAVFKKIKLRYSEFDLDKYRQIMKNLAYSTINSIK